MSEAPATPYKKGDAVEVRRLAGWTAGTVVNVTVLRPGRFLYQVAVSDSAPRSYRIEQVRTPQTCADCARVQAENNDLRAELQLVRGELRKWVEAG